MDFLIQPGNGLKGNTKKCVSKSSSNKFCKVNCSSKTGGCVIKKQK